MSEHTPIPWKASKHMVLNVAQSTMIASCFEYCQAEGITDAEPNAAFIVKCVNSHEQLVEALDNLTNEVIQRHKAGIEAVGPLRDCVLDAKDALKDAGEGYIIEELCYGDKTAGEGV